MDKETMTDAQVMAMMNGKFVSVKMDMEHGEGLKIAMKYHVSAFPSFLFFDEAGNIVSGSAGYQKAPDFVKTMNSVLDKSKQFHATGYSKSLDVDFPKFYVASHAENGKREFPKAEEVTKWFNSQSIKMSEAAFAAMCMYQAGPAETKFFLDHFGELKALYGDYAVNEKMDAIIGNKLEHANKTKNSKEFDEAIKMLDKYEPGDNARTKNFYALSFYQAAEKWTEFEKSLNTYFDFCGTDDHMSINNKCWEIYESKAPKNIVELACNKMNKVIAAEPKYMYLDTYAALLYKSGKKEEAKQWAQKAITAGKSEGTETESTEKLLKEMNK